jgi:hypothetical protein
MKKTTINTTTQATNAARPARKSTTASVLTREIHTQKLTCPECKGVNGLHRLNQPCDFCGFVLSVRLFPDFSHYVRGLDTTASGRDTFDIADATADDLRGLNEREVVEATARALAQLPITVGLSTKLGWQFKAAGFAWSQDGIENWLDARYEGRNPGMVRMNCGNILRAAGKRSTDEANA